MDPQTATAFRINDALALAAYMRRAEKEQGIDDAVLQRITTPALLFVGSRDRERLPDTEHLASLIPDSALTVIEGLITRAQSRTPKLCCVRSFRS